MSDPPSAPRRRSRRRATSPQGAPEPAETQTPPVVRTEPDPRPKKDTQRRRRPTHEAALRDLVGSGHSQLGVSGALRGRDVNRPTEQDLAEAERDVVIVRRHWTPKPEA